MLNMLYNIQIAEKQHEIILIINRGPWQDVDYVPGYFCTTSKSPRNAYVSYVDAGIDQGRQDELTRVGSSVEEERPLRVRTGIV